MDKQPVLLGAELSIQPHEYVISNSNVWIVDPKFIFTSALWLQK